MKQTQDTADSRYPRRLDHVVWKVIDGKGILLNLEDGAYFEVDPVGLAIWQHCDGRKTPETITQNVAKEFSGEPSRVSKDLSVFLRDLKSRKLIGISGEPAPAASRG